MHGESKTSKLFPQTSRVKNDKYQVSFPYDEILSNLMYSYTPCTLCERAFKLLDFHITNKVVYDNIDLLVHQVPCWYIRFLFVHYFTKMPNVPTLQKPERGGN